MTVPTCPEPRAHLVPRPGLPSLPGALPHQEGQVFPGGQKGRGVSGSKPGRKRSGLRSPKALICVLPPEITDQTSWMGLPAGKLLLSDLPPQTSHPVSSPMDAATTAVCGTPILRGKDGFLKDMKTHRRDSGREVEAGIHDLWGVMGRCRGPA